MSRPLRIEYPGAWYHVMNRGAARQRIFHAPGDYETFLALSAWRFAESTKNKSEIPASPDGSGDWRGKLHRLIDNGRPGTFCRFSS